ncbi:MAG: sulfatase-like hydrolase/transferase, partial [Phycisphaerae bacterium]
ELGYRTGCFGKWHVGCTPVSHPCRNGFDRFVGLPYSNDMDPLPLFEDFTCVEEDPDQAWLTRRYCDAAMDFIDQAGEQPWCAYIAHTMPHIPLHVEKEFRGKSNGGTYGDTIECIDYHLGRLMDRLDELGLSDDTLLIVTSDNGPWFEGSTGGLRGRKFDVYEGGVRAPFVAKLPGRIPAGNVCEQPASLLDMLPTFAGLARAEVPGERPIDGRDIWQAFTGGDVPQREAYYFFFHDTLQAVRVGKWKLHVAFGFDDKTKEMPQLFDMDLDPQESYNLADNHPEVVEKLRGLIEKFAAEVKADRESSR